MGGIRVTSEVNLMIWQVLKDNSIEIPFPQRTLHIPGSVDIHTQTVQQNPST